MNSSTSLRLRAASGTVLVAFGAVRVTLDIEDLEKLRASELMLRQRLAYIIYKLIEERPDPITKELVQEAVVKRMPESWTDPVRDMIIPYP
jgi:hypothetical protein